jgi:hypothetical protein
MERPYSGQVVEVAAEAHKLLLIFLMGEMVE